MCYPVCGMKHIKEPLKAFSTGAVEAHLTLEYSLVGSVVLLFLSLFVCVCGYIVVVGCDVMYALVEVFVVCLLSFFVPFSFFSFFFLFNCCCSYRIFCISLDAGWTVRTRPND